MVPDGIHAWTDQLQRAAADVRGDAGALDTARSAASVAAQAAGSAAGGGALTAAASEFASQMDKVMGAVARAVEECATALEASATTYLDQDRGAANSLDGLLLPGAPPR